MLPNNSSIMVLGSSGWKWTKERVRRENGNTRSTKLSTSSKLSSVSSVSF